jgi:hypothetical protein
MEEPGHDRAGFLSGETNLDFDTCLPQPVKAAAIDARIRVLQRGIHACDAGRYDGLRAGRCLTPVAAGLERDIQNGTARPIPCVINCNTLCMGPAAELRLTSADNLAIAYDDATHRRVRPDSSLHHAR